MEKINYKGYKRPSDYVCFEIGENRIRVISSGAMGLQHGLRTANRWVNLGLCTGDNCEHCAKGNLAKRFWRWIVYDYADAGVKMLDAGPMIGNQICELADKLNDDPQNYDLIIVRKGLGLKTKYETRKAPENKEPEKEGIKSKKRYLINKYFVQ